MGTHEPQSRREPQPRPPSVERLLTAARPRLAGERDHAALVRAAREVQAEERERLLGGTSGRPLDELVGVVLERLGPAVSGPATVINATGVILHTNLGRARWPREAVEAAARAASEHVLLELDPLTGRRGARFRGAEEHLIALTGAGDALVVNNNAAALALAVGLAGRRGVVVSRGELVEIGGGVRIPEVIRRAGARLVEVGTTNRTRVGDFTAPLEEGRAALVLRVHRSNFRQEGFVEGPEHSALARLARRHGVPLVDDLGSGALLETAELGLAHEPTPMESLAAGSDLVTFSGDKLLGGPQAGLIVGRQELVARLRRDPLARAMRPDKVTLAALTATLAIYRSGRALSDIPVWRSIRVPVEELRARADRLAADLAGASWRAEAIDTTATIGGGSLPGQTLPSAGLRLRGAGAVRLAARLRVADPCVIATIRHAAVVADLRTVDPDQDELLRTALRSALEEDAG
jgi:L-seryl-tRNA(Ser) seleniumtransferase